MRNKTFNKEILSFYFSKRLEGTTGKKKKKSTFFFLLNCNSLGINKHLFFMRCRLHLREKKMEDERSKAQKLRHFLLSHDIFRRHFFHQVCGQVVLKLKIY